MTSIARDPRYCVRFSRTHGVQVLRRRDAVITAESGDVHLIGCWLDAQVAASATKRLRRTKTDLEFWAAVHDTLSCTTKEDRAAAQHVNSLLCKIEHDLIANKIAKH